MKMFYKKAISLCIIIISFVGAFPAYAAAPYRYFSQEIEMFTEHTEFANLTGKTMPVELVLPKYIGSFTTEMTFGTFLNENVSTSFVIQEDGNYSKTVKIAVVRANPISLKDLKMDNVQDLQNSIIQMARISSGQTLETIVSNGPNGFILPYEWNDKANGFLFHKKSKAVNRSGDEISVQLCEASNYLLDANPGVLYNSGGPDGDFSSGFDCILPLTEEDEAYFLETGKLNVEDWGWSKIDWSGLKTVLTNPESAPPVDISLNMEKVRTYQAEPIISTVRIEQLDDKEYNFNTYRIRGNICYRLGDVLAAINGIDNQANIIIHPETNKVEIFKGQPYTLTGKEFQAVDGTVKTAEGKRMLLYKKDYEGNYYIDPCMGYVIDGEYYFSLSDIRSMTNFTIFRGEYPNNIFPKIKAGKPDGILRIY